MIKEVFNAIASATRHLFRSWRVLLILLVLYLAILESVYLFFSTREATVAQLLLSLALGILAVVLWLVIQAIAVRHASEDRAGKLLVRSFSDFWKLGIIVLPVVLLIGLLVYLVGSIELASVQETARSVAAPHRVAGTRTPASSPSWQVVAVSTLQYLLIGLVLPLASIHLWIEAARRELQPRPFYKLDEIVRHLEREAYPRRSPRAIAWGANAIRNFARTISHAFSPRSVLTYAIGFVVFAVIPYVLVTKRTPVTSPWLDVSLLGARLALAVVLSLIGWVVTVAALTRLATSRPASPSLLIDGFPIKGSSNVPADS